MARKQSKPSLLGLKYADTIVERVRKYPELAIAALPILLNLSSTRIGNSEQCYRHDLESYIHEFPQTFDLAIELTTAEDYAEQSRLSASRIGINHPQVASKIIERLKGVTKNWAIYDLGRLGQYCPEPTISHQAINALVLKKESRPQNVFQAIKEIAQERPESLSTAVDALLEFEGSETKILEFIDEPGFSDWQVDHDYKNGEERKSLATRAFEVIATRPASLETNDSILRAGVLFPHLTIRALDLLSTREGVDMADAIRKILDVRNLRVENAFERAKLLVPTDDVIKLIRDLGRYDEVTEAAIEYLAVLPESDLATSAIGQVGKWSANEFQRAIEILEPRKGDVATKAISEMVRNENHDRRDNVFEVLVRRGDYDSAKNLIVGVSSSSNYRGIFETVAKSDAVANVPEEHRPPFTQIALDAFSKLFVNAAMVTEKVRSDGVKSLAVTLARAAEMGNPLSLPVEDMSRKVQTVRDFYAMFEAK